MDEPVEETRETVKQTEGGTVRARTVATDNPTRPYAQAQLVIGWLAGIVLSLLGIRFLLSLLGANQSNAFASFIYVISYPLVAPFFGLFGYQMQYGVARFEIETLVAMLVYALVGFGIAQLFRIGRVR